MYVLGCYCMCLGAIVCARVLLYVLRWYCMCFSATVCDWVLLYGLGCYWICCVARIHALVSADLFYSTLSIGVSDLISLRMCYPIGG